MGDLGETTTDSENGARAWPFPRLPQRVAPLGRDDRPEKTEEMLRELRGDNPDGPDANLFATFAHHPRLMKRWLPFGFKLLYKGELSDRDRELLILRTAWNCQVLYEWAHHIPIAKEAGLGDAGIAHAAAGPDAPGLSADDATLLRAADELLADKRISDATWATLAARYTEAQLIEVCMVVGHYQMLGMVVRSLGIEVEDDGDGHDASGTGTG